MTARTLGSLTSEDIGKVITEPHRDGMPRGWRPARGVIASLRHYRLQDDTYTSVLVKVPAPPREADHREIRATSDLQAEVGR